MQRLLSIAVAAVNAVGLLGCGASAGEPEADADRLQDQQPLPVVVPPPVAVQSDIESKQIGDVWLFSRTPDEDEIQFQGLLQATPRIESGCLKVGDVVVVWDQANLTVAEGLVTELQAGQFVGEVSLGGGVPPARLTMEIEEQCSSGAVVFNTSSEVSVAAMSDK
jgi:hypothetical protein